MSDLCDAIQDRLVKLHLTGIPIADDPEVKAHLATCSICRIYDDHLNHDHRALEVYAKSLDIYVDQVKQRLHRQIEHTKPKSPNQATCPWWAVAAAIALVAGLIFLFNGGHNTPSDQPDSNRGPVSNQSTAPIPAANPQAVNQIKQHSQDVEGLTSEPAPSPPTKRVAVTPAKANQPRAEMAEVPMKEETGLRDELKEELNIDHVGTVVTAKGDPVPNIQVFLCEVAMDVSVSNGIPSSDANAVRTDVNGRFLIDSERPIKYLVAVGTEGIAQIEYNDLQEHRIITLAPWVTVKGDLMEGTNPVVGYMLETLTHDALESRGGYDAYSQCATDVEGRFEFGRIPPGHMILYGRDYEVCAGKTYELHLPVGGQIVTGQFILPGYTDRGGVLRGEPVISQVISLDTGKDHVDMSPQPEIETSQVFQQICSNEMGQFLIDHLEPGHYALTGGSLNHDNTDRQKRGYRIWHEFEVPEPSDPAQRDIPIELGDVELIPGDLLVGDRAPGFDLVDFDGNPRNLNDAAEKLVLLSFYRWDDLKRPSLELLALNDVEAQFGPMESFVMIGMLASTNSPSQDRELVQAAGLTWSHLTVGRNGLNRTHIEYDVLNVNWPWNILISPNGTILAIGLQGDELIQAIEIHMP